MEHTTFHLPRMKHYSNIGKIISVALQTPRGWPPDGDRSDSGRVEETLVYTSLTSPTTASTEHSLHLGESFIRPSLVPRLLTEPSLSDNILNFCRETRCNAKHWRVNQIKFAKVFHLKTRVCIINRIVLV